MDVLGSLMAKILRTRALVRAPIWLYRRGMGWLFGSRVLMLTHTGRRSGRDRFVCLEVVDRPDRWHLVVVSGFGTQSQWYRNLIADPRCRVSCGPLRDAAAVATLIGAADSALVLTRYAERHRTAWRRLRRGIETAVGHPVETLPMMELTLVGGSGQDGSRTRSIT